MNIDLLHLKSTIWKSFDVFPKDSDLFIQSDYATSYTTIFACVPSVFTSIEGAPLNYEVMMFVGDSKKVVDARLLFSTGVDSIAEIYKFLKRMKSFRRDKSDEFIFKNQIVKIMDDYCTEGYFPDKKRWCYDYEFQALFQKMMFLN